MRLSRTALEAEVALRAEGDLNVCGRASGRRFCQVSFNMHRVVQFRGGGGPRNVQDLFIDESASNNKTPPAHLINNR